MIVYLTHATLSKYHPVLIFLLESDDETAKAF